MSLKCPECGKMFIEGHSNSFGIFYDCKKCKKSYTHEKGKMTEQKMGKKQLKLAKFVLIQVEKNYIGYSVFVKDRTLFIVGRSEEHGRKVFFVNDFYPRFYIEKEEKEILENFKDRIHLIKDDNFKNLGGTKELLEVSVINTQDIVDIRGEFNKTYEANVKITEVFKRNKQIKKYFFVPEYLLTFEPRQKQFYGVNVTLLKETEIKGEEMKHE